MLVIGQPTPKPEIPIEGPGMIIPLICIGTFFLVILALFGWFFYTMHSGNARSRIRQEKIYKSRFLKKVAQYYASTPGFRFPKTHGANAWKSWLKK